MRHRPVRRSAGVASAVLMSTMMIAATPSPAQKTSRPPLAAADVDAIAALLMLEDARKFDFVELRRILKSPHPEVRRRAVQSIGRIADKRGAPLLETARQDKDVEVVATAMWAGGQLRDPIAVPWLNSALSAAKMSATIAREAAIALGKIQSPEAHAALAQYLASAPLDSDASVIGEALLSIGRFPAGEAIDPILRWTTSSSIEIRWRATWALFRPRDPAALKELLRLSTDPSADVRCWAVRGLIPHTGVDSAPAAARLRDAVRDPDRRVRTEALRTLGLHDDEASVKVVLETLDSRDTWLSVSAAEALARQTERAELVIPRLVAAAGLERPLSLRLTARQSLGRLGTVGKITLDRGNLSWASAGLDTGRPGYTLGVTPQPHNEGNFTALGRVVGGMEVVEQLELNDAITAALMVR